MEKNELIEENISRKSEKEQETIDLDKNIDIDIFLNSKCKENDKETIKDFSYDLEIGTNDNFENKKLESPNKKLTKLKASNLGTSLMTKVVQKQIKENFSLDNVGRIDLAKEHRSANRPLYKKNKFNKETKFCQCCNLPCQQEGVIEPFSFCESVKNFASCGKGVYLYFFYIIFAIFCFIIVGFISSISFIYLSLNYSNDFDIICSDKIKNMEDKYNLSSKCDSITNQNKNFNTSEYILFYSYSIYSLEAYKELCEYMFQGNKGICQKSIFNYSLISFFSMMTLLVFNILYLYIFHSVNNELNEGLLPSDYTLLITNLRELYNNYKANCKLNDSFNIENFESYLKKELFGSKNENKDMIKSIYSINLCYEMDEYMAIEKKCEEYKYKIFQIDNNPYQKKKNEQLKYEGEHECYFLMPFTIFGCLFSLTKGEQKFHLYNKKGMKENELNNLLEQGRKLDKFAGRMFVTFNTVKDKEKYYKRFPHYFIEKVFYFFKNIKSYLYSFFNSEKNKTKLRKKVNVYHANEPEDIIWENIEFNSCKKIQWKLFIYLICFSLLALLFKIILKLTQLQNNLLERNWNIITINTVSYMIAILILIVNKIFQEIIEFLTKFEKPNSYSDLYLSCSIKLTFFYFSTSAFIPAFCNMVNRNNKLFVKNVRNLFIINAITLPLPFQLIIYFFKKIRICLIKKGKKIYIRQKELNELYELPEMNISYKYSDVAQTILMTFFYMPIFPFGPIISTIGLILTYFCQKLYFITFYKRPEMLNEVICKFYFEYFIVGLWIYAIGDYIFTKSLYNTIIFSILTIIPYNKFLSYYFDKKIVVNKKSIPISKVYFSFYNDYERQNPITKKEGLCKYIELLRKNNLISEKLKNIAIENISNVNIMEVYYKSSLKRSLMKSQMAFTKNKNCSKQPLKNKEIASSETNLNFNDKDDRITNKETNYHNIINSNNNNNNNNKDEMMNENNDNFESFKDNNSLMIEAYNFPILLGINNSIRMSFYDFGNFSTNIENIPKNINNESNRITTKIEKGDQNLNPILEVSNEYENYNTSRLNRLDSYNTKKDNINFQYRLSNTNFSNLKTRNNPLYKSYNHKTNENKLFNEFSSSNNLDYLNQEKNSKEQKFPNIIKSAFFLKKNHE